MNVNCCPRKCKQVLSLKQTCVMPSGDGKRCTTEISSRKPPQTHRNADICLIEPNTPRTSFAGLSFDTNKAGDHRYQNALNVNKNMKPIHIGRTGRLPFIRDTYERTFKAGQHIMTTEFLKEPPGGSASCSLVRLALCVPAQG